MQRYSRFILNRNINKFLLISLLVICVNQALGAQSAKIGSGGAQVLKDPEAQSEVQFEVDEGLEVQASNKPTSGYYRVRLPGGEVGWILGSKLIGLKELPPEVESSQKPKVSSNASDQENQESPLEALPAQESSKNKPKKAPFVVSKPLSEVNDPLNSPIFRKKRKWLKFKVSGQMMFPSLPDLTTVAGSNVFAQSFGLGLQTDFVIKNIEIGIAGSYSSRSRVIRDLSTQTVGVYEWSIDTIPVEAVVALQLADLPEGSITLGVTGGRTVLNRFLSVADHLVSAQNQTLYQADCWVVGGKFGFTWNASKNMGLFMDIGYRIYLSALTQPLIIADTATVLTTSGSPMPLNLNFTSPYLHFGIQWSL